MPTGHRAEAPPGWLRVAYEGTQGPCSWAVVHWFTIMPTVEPTPSDLLTLLNTLAEIYNTWFVDIAEVSNQVAFTTVRGVFSNATPPDKTRAVKVVDFAGGGSGAIEPGQVCFLINWQTQDGRRGGKPRSYIPGVQALRLEDSGNLGSGDVVFLSGQANGYHNAVNAVVPAFATEMHFVDASFVDGGAYRVTPRAFEIFGGNCSAVVGTQRRRVDRLRVT